MYPKYTDFDKFVYRCYTAYTMIQRFYKDLGSFLHQSKALVLYGPRRVGKTTLLEQFLKTTALKYKLDSGDNIRTQQILSSQNFPRILEYVEGYDLLAIDEAQQIPNVGMGLKIIVDQRPDIRIIATGSSSFDLAGAVGEPLTGRKRTLTLYPVAQLELASKFNRHELKERLPEFLVFGSYPEVVTAVTKKEKKSILDELVHAALLKDILALERIKGSQILLNLLKLIAFQVGHEVSHSELATQLALNVRTVQRYLDLLEKTFVLFRLGGFSRNLRKEVARKHKYYFFDLGIRNAIIAQFNELDLRNDIGQLWENFIIVERMKKREYYNIFSSSYFWRTYDQQEIDLIEEREGSLFAYECKWAKTKSVVAPADWKTAYPNASFATITPENYLDFVM